MRMSSRVLVMILCALVFGLNGVSESQTRNTDEAGGQIDRGFIPQWSVGDWWVVGVAVQDLRHGSITVSDSTTLEKPIVRSRYEVVALTVWDSIPCYLVEVKPVSCSDPCPYTDTLYYDQETIRPLAFNHYRIDWVTPGPYVLLSDGYVSIPPTPQFPLAETDIEGDAGRSEAERVPREGRWTFMGVQETHLGPGRFGVQVVTLTDELDDNAVLGSDLQRFSVPRPPYFEALIAHGTNGERLVKQVWHRDLPWYLFCEDGHFPMKPMWKAEMSSVAPWPKAPKPEDIDREDLSRVKASRRGWLLDYGHGCGSAE